MSWNRLMQMFSSLVSFTSLFPNAILTWRDLFVRILSICLLIYFLKSTLPLCIWIAETSNFLQAHYIELVPFKTDFTFFRRGSLVMFRRGCAHSFIHFSNCLLQTCIRHTSCCCCMFHLVFSFHVFLLLFIFVLPIFFYRFFPLS